MIVYEFKNGNSRLVYADKNEGKGKFIKEHNAKTTRKHYSKNDGKNLKIGDVVTVNKYGAFYNLIDFKAEIIESETGSSLTQKIINTTSMHELDSLRNQIVSDKQNFFENQKLFIKRKKQLKR